MHALVFDLDGTLVDSVYAHVLAWQGALGEAGVFIDGYRLHRHVGSSGGLIIRYAQREASRELSAEQAETVHRRHEELFRQITLEEPRPLRRFNPAVPADLETIVLKAMAKEPIERYATARELADDLRRFRELKPIKARRPTLWDRALKGARRHVAVVADRAGAGPWTVFPSARRSSATDGNLRLTATNGNDGNGSDSWCDGS